jgi:hypothetical protein
MTMNRWWPLAAIALSSVAMADEFNPHEQLHQSPTISSYHWSGVEQNSAAMHAVRADDLMTAHAGDQVVMRDASTQRLPRSQLTRQSTRSFPPGRGRLLRAPQRGGGGQKPTVKQGGLSGGSIKEQLAGEKAEKAQPAAK